MRMIHVRIGFLPALGVMVACGRCVAGEVTVYYDQDEWETALGAFMTMDFTGFPQSTPITDQYADIGVTFTDGSDYVFLNPGFENDGAGLNGVGDIEMAFGVTTYGIAASFPGLMQFDLYSQGDLIYTSGGGFGGSGTGWFVGLISYHPFDYAILSDPSDGAVFADDIYFGPRHLPAPPVLGLFALAPALGSRRRRRSP